MTGQEAESIIQSLPFAKIEIPFSLDANGTLTGSVGILHKSMSSAIVFKVIIHPFYPCKILGHEPIQFVNLSLIEYPHIMSDGSLCFHTSYLNDEKERLYSDLIQLLEWIEKYYIKGIKDKNYEHLVTVPSVINGCYYALHFTQTDIVPIKGECGFAFISFIKDGIHKGKRVRNMLLNFFGDDKKKPLKSCMWSTHYKNLTHIAGPYCILDTPPAIYGKFAPSEYTQLNGFLSQKQLNFIHLYEKSQYRKLKGQYVPLLIGYKIPDGSIHWQAPMLKVGDFPICGIAERKDGKKTGIWNTQFTDGKIDWAMTYDSSYEKFFGRGVYEDSFTNKSILILGVGAIGSMISKTLVKCGCRNLSLCDYDVKKPENVCRSEYDFSNGICDKSYELANILSCSSPHVKANPLTEQIEYLLKTIVHNELNVPEVKQTLNEFDLIFDCSTDDDTMRLLEKLQLRCDIVNISITNHASELICGFSPNISTFVQNAFSSIVENDLSDLYAPSGCWSPTFKASYNDIALMVQYALKHIHRMLIGIEEKHNFILRDSQYFGKNLPY